MGRVSTKYTHDSVYIYLLAYKTNIFRIAKKAKDILKKKSLNIDNLFFFFQYLNAEAFDICIF